MARLCLDFVCTGLAWVFLIYITAAIQITGASGGVNLATGERPFRYEISEFAASGAAYDLYILALRQLQNTNQNDPLSFFQIAGIHGYPQRPWDDVLGDGNHVGYCTHAAVTFPTWHRPYLALFEQVVWTNAQIIARTYPLSVRDQYTSAAATLRIPYWDWAAYPYLPDAVSQPTVTINAPDGDTTLANPLYAYTFQNTAQEQGFPPTSPLANATQSIRHWDQETQQSNQAEASATLMGQAPTILSLTYQVLTAVTNYMTVSSTSTGGGTDTDANIENIHNSIHNSVGGNGHMAWVEFAAFDPIFFVHHANVDRIFAMWQTLNPQSYIQPTVNTVGSYYEPVGFIDSGNTSLAPFHSDNGTTMYTSDDVRGTLRFGYTYPELVDWNINAAELISNLRTKINLLYNPSLSSSNTSRGAMERPLARTAGTAHAFDHITFHDAKALGINNLNMLWNIEVRVPRYACNSPFLIDFFMGAPEPDPGLRSTAANLVGSHVQFIASDVSKMFPNGVPHALDQGHVSLSHTLAASLDRGLIRDLKPRNVVPLVEKQLKWNARSADGRDIDVGALKGLSIMLTSKTVQPATSADEFPKYGKLRYWPMATRGKVGGWQKFDF